MTYSTFVGRRPRARLLLLSMTALCSAGAATPLLAQSAPVRQSIDANGVDLFLGTINVDAPAVTIGAGDAALTYQKAMRGGAWYDNMSPYLVLNGSVMTVSLGGVSDSFTGSGSSWANTQGNGATLAFDGTVYTYTRADGTAIHFNRNYGLPNIDNSPGRATDVTMPSGARLTYTFDAITYCRTSKPSAGRDICTTHGTVYRISTVRNSFGYQLQFRYDEIAPYDPESVTDGPDLGTWSAITGVSTSNLARNVSGPGQTFGGSPGTGVFSVSDAHGTTSYRSSGGTFGIKRAGQSAETTTVSFSGNRVSSVTNGSGTTGYAASDANGERTVTVTDALSHATAYVFEIASQRLRRVTDALSHVTSWEYDPQGRATKVTSPEGNATSEDDGYVRYTYDGRGNVKLTRRVAKAGSGLADIVTSAVYPDSCTPATAATCNQPISTTDARGATTDYTYYDHGGVKSVTGPAPIPTPNAVRPQTRYGYASMQSSAGGDPVYRLTETSTCATRAACAPSGDPADRADEVRTSITYDPGNLQPVSVTTGSGDGLLSATTATTYDAVGNVEAVDGPLPGTDDTVRFGYDGARNRTGVLYPDPDGAGTGRRRRSVRAWYDGDDQPSDVEQGVSDADWANYTASQALHTDHDAYGRRTGETLSAGGVTYGHTDWGYDLLGRGETVTVRMNGDGADRVTRTDYDALNRVTKVTSGYGTAEGGDDVRTTYTANGQVESVTDGEGNRTGYEYDGHDRLSVTRYPVTARGANASSATDYEQLGYDANGNVTDRRLRDGQHIGYGYDALDRLVAKDMPGTEPDVGYSYDLLGRVTVASDTAGHGEVFGYDALGRVVSDGQALGTMSSRYDAAGRRTRLTWPDGRYVTYEYDATGATTAIRNDDAGATVLASYSYDDLGRRVGLTRGNGTTTTYGYDAASRLTSLAHDIGGTGYDQTYGFTYNAAGQIATRTGSNDAYAWGGTTEARGYAVNGLNQYTTAGGAGQAYDARGNLTGSGGDAFGYDADNRLTGMTLGSVHTDVRHDLRGGIDATSSFNPGLGFAITTSLLRDLDGSVVGRRLSGGGQVTLLERFVPGPGVDEHAVWFKPDYAPAPIYFHADERGSVVALSFADGSGNGINWYDEAGIPAVADGRGLYGPFGYTGQYILADGLYDYKARVYSPRLGRFLQTDPIGYGDGLNWYGYAGGDPVNWTDPSGLSVSFPRSCPAGGGDVVVCGHRGGPDPLGGPLGGGSLFGNAHSVGLNMHSDLDDDEPEDVVVVAVRKKAKSNRSVGRLVSRTSKPFTCFDAAKQPGRIVTSGVSATGVLALGLTATKGKWTNMSTGATGQFTTFGFAAGVAAGGSIGGQTYSSMNAFTGWSDGYVLGLSVPVGPFSLGGSYASSWNDSGSGSGGSFDVGSPGLPFFAVSSSFTETTISGCKPGGM